MKRDPSGFTLIETAIVLVVIGLLLGAVFKGQELINGARVKHLAGDFKNVPTYVNAYQDKFRALPGDDAELASHLPGATPCSPAAAGKCVVGNGVIDGKWSDTTVASESYVFWQHLRLAGLAPGSTDTSNLDGDYIPRNTVGGKIGVTSSSPIIGLRGTYIFCSDAIPGKFAKQLDITMDDGNTATGFMQAVAAGTTVPGNPIQTTNIVDNALYLVCMSA
jgi:prepilin-type N-terminal cleavage/methylation domain-containing protein